MKIGTRLGPYEIVAPLGAGGMGEVYRAQDTKLGRDVAIKVLPEEFTEHPEKLARFDREARFLASLNHPGIATLHGLEKADGKPFLVMELVEGETLAERIAGGPIPVKEAMTLAQQIAEALEAAHEKGVIHRDLKPANIKVDAEGKVKVLDFGLAKAFGDELPDSDLSKSPTLSRDATGRGVILGTAVYMSPEQARGKAVDKRTDIFSFGAVLYEMLTGNKAFSGEDVQEVLANVIKGEPDWKALPSDIPSPVVKLLRRCLKKDRKERLQAVGDVRVEIREILDERDTVVSSETAQNHKPALAWVLVGILGIALLASLWSPWRPVSQIGSGSPMHLSVKLGVAEHRIMPTAGRHGAMAVLSPDGKTLAFLGSLEGTRGIYLRSFDSLEATPLSGTEDAASPFFSPDGRWLGFFTPVGLKKVSVSGGAALTLAEAATAGGAWGPDDSIVYSPTNTSGLYRIPASGGTPVELTTLEEGERTHRWPSFLPNGKAVLFAVQTQTESFNDATIEAVLLETGERKVLLRGGTYPRYASTGHLLYARESTIFAMPFDEDRVEPTGEPSPILEGVLTYGVNNGASYYALSEVGSLVYVRGQVALEEARRELVRVDREGNASVLTETLGDWETPRLSHDGQRLAIRRMGASGGTDQDVWILELSRGTLTRLTFGDGLRPLWSPDDETIFFASTRTGNYEIYAKPADGTDTARQLTTSTNYRTVPSSITSDGKTIVFRRGLAGEALDVGMMNLEGDGEPEMLLEESYNEHTPKLSPDDQWLAYVSDETGRDEIYVTRFPTGGKWQISTEGGTEPLWSRNGRELFYRNGEKMMAVDVSQGADKPGRPTLLFEAPFDLKDGPGATNYDVAPDGQGFIMIRSIERGTQELGVDTVTLVLNWFEELKRLAPTE